MSELSRISSESPEDCEAMLAALGPAPSRLTADRALRDRLMFEAGRAASVSDRSDRSDRSDSQRLRSLTLPARRREIWSYSLASAAAAALAVILTRTVMTPQLVEVTKPSDAPQQAAPQILAEQEPNKTAPQAAQGSSDSFVEAKQSQAPRSAPVAHALGSPWGIFHFPQGALLAQRNRLLLEEEFRFSEPRGEPDAYAETSYTPPTTALELRAEYLPPRSEIVATPSAWQWLTNWTQRGEEI